MGIIKEHKTTINGTAYKCKTFPASEGLVILPKIISLVGDKVTNLMFGVGDEGIESLMEDKKVMMQIMVNIAERAEQNDGLLVLRDLMKYTTFTETFTDPATKEVNGLDRSVYDKFDEHFAADYMNLMNVAMWVGRASFANS